MNLNTKKMYIYASTHYSDESMTLAGFQAIAEQLGLILRILIMIMIISSCESNRNFYRPDLPEKLCVVGIIDADDTLSINYQDPYSHNNWLRIISFEKSYQSEYPEERDDSLRDFTVSIYSQNEEMYSYCSDACLKNLKSYKLPSELNFISGEKYFLKAQAEGLNEVSAEVKVPESPSNIVVNSIHKETEPSLKFSRPDCNWPNHDSIKYIVVDISFNPMNDSYYAILLEGYGYNFLLPPGILGFLDFTVRNNSVNGFNAILYGLKMSHLNCSGDGPILLQSKVKAFFIDGNNILGDVCNLTLSVKYNDGYSLYHGLRSFRIKLLSIPEGLYDFEKNLYRYEKTAEDPFAEPVYLNGNIKNGNGIFAICRSKYISVLLPLGY